ncbi:hypothetical protein KAI87_11250 [Myxococcota bacterium]|nr:hypothetical protein [Myxococcota bacterium]
MRSIKGGPLSTITPPKSIGDLAGSDIKGKPTPRSSRKALDPESRTANSSAQHKDGPYKANAFGYGAAGSDSNTYDPDAQAYGVDGYEAEEGALPTDALIANIDSIPDLDSIPELREIREFDHANLLKILAPCVDRYGDAFVGLAKFEGSILKGLQGAIHGEAHLINMIEMGGRGIAVFGQAYRELNAGEVVHLDKAVSSIQQYAALEKKAILASKLQSKFAKSLGNFNKTVDSKTIIATREKVAMLSRRASNLHHELAQLKPSLAHSNHTVRTLGKRLYDSGKTLGVADRAKVILANTKLGRKVLKAGLAAADSKVAKVVSKVGKSKSLKVVGGALISAAIVADGYEAYKKGTTIKGKSFRAVAQSGASAMLYTQPLLVPVLAAESFIMDAPHMTGPIQSLVQTGGVAVDYVLGSEGEGYEALYELDADMKSGLYGGVIKGANYFGEALKDDGASAVIEHAIDYWSDVSPSEAWKDTKDVWNWLF